MKIISFILFCLLLVPESYSQVAAYIGLGKSRRHLSHLYGPAPYAADPCTGCTNETFEGSGYSVAGWTETGFLLDEDYTTSPAPIIGSQSFLVLNSSGNAAFSEHAMPSSSEAWMRFAVIFTNTVADTWGIAMMLNGVSEVASIRINSGSISVKAGGAAIATTAATLTADTTNYIWFHYRKGSGTDAVGDVAFAVHPNKLRPTSGSNFAQVTTGNSSVNMDKVWAGGGDITFGGVSSGAIYDNVSITTLGSIGDFP